MTKRPNYVFDDELYHHGILGQRWGHRRFQNEDGSWTPEGRERYGEGDARSKAKATYETQKYKANLKSKAQKEKDVRAAKEERNRIKEQAKTNKLIKKEQAKLDQQGAKKFRNTKKMSDEDLQSAIDRLKLQSEYNKQYALAKNPDGALAKADRFFSGPTGEAVRAMAVAAMPNLASSLGNLANTALTSKLKYANKEDREKQAADIEKVRAEAESFRSKAAFQDAQTKEKLGTISNNNAKTASELKDAELTRRETMRKANIENAKARSELEDAKTNRQITRTQAAVDVAKQRQEMKIERDNQYGFEGIGGNGQKVHMMGQLEADAGKRKLTEIFAEKKMTAAQRNYEQVLNANLTGQYVDIATRRQDAEAKRYRDNLTAESDAQDKWHKRNIEKQEADTKNFIKKQEAATKAADSQHRREVEKSRVSAEIARKNAEIRRYDAQTNKQYSSSNSSGRGIPLSNNTLSQINSMMSSGKYTAEEVADKLGISVSTIWKHRK